MPRFTALNFDPEDDVDDEVDNTKEIQIEDALKLYQSALKAHSQGNFPLAAEAYTNLFKSEVFKYPESITEFARLEQHPELESNDPYLALDLELAAAAVADEIPSTLPQILFLSYKNHGQFILDCVKGRLKHDTLDRPAINCQAKAAIDNFALAIASDETDADLWRKAARVGLMLGSRKISRFCLEAAVELDDDPTVAEVEPPSIEEAFAGEQLKAQLEVLSDETSLSHPIMGPFRRKQIPQFLSKHIDPFPYLPNTDNRLSPGGLADDGAGQKARLTLEIPFRTWTSVGEEFCNAFISTSGTASRGLSIQLPGQVAQSTEVEMLEPTNLVDEVAMKTVGVIESPVAESSETTSATPTASKQDEVSVEIVTTTTTIPLSGEPSRQSSTALPTRKRSQSAAGLADTPEDDSGAQKRSKRIRNRDAPEVNADPATQFAEQLKDFNTADETVFAFVSSLLNELGVRDLGTFPELQAVLSKENGDDNEDAVANTAVRDLRDILRSWDDSKASSFAHANAASILGSSAGSANAGLAAFLEQAKSGPPKVSTIPPFQEDGGLSEFQAKLEAGWVPLQDAMYEWLLVVLKSYQNSRWPHALQVSVVRIISVLDAEIYERLKVEAQNVKDDENSNDLVMFAELVETLFELHLDTYSRITKPGSSESFENRTMTKDRLDRWADFSADLIHRRGTDLMDTLTIRYLWASVFFTTLPEVVSRDHKVLCWTDIQTILKGSEIEIVELPNNFIMPEISVAAAEREVSRLTTMEFFFNLFQTDTSEPLAIIETLEPVLDPESAYQSVETGSDDTVAIVEAAEGTPAALREMWKFLKTGSTSLRLFLWQRLKEAYQSIGYNTKVFSCHLKCIEIIVGDLRSEDYVNSTTDSRHHQLLLWLKALDDLLVKSLTIALNDTSTCFEIIDERHIKTTCAAIAQLNRILHSAALFDDEIRVGMTQLPSNQIYGPNGSFVTFTNKLREMQVRTWALQYTMVKEAMSQNLETFKTPDNDLADFLAYVHYILGLRKCCKSSNKIFLKMMKVELNRLKNIDKWEDYVGQVLYDLYGLRLGFGTFLLEEHGCHTEAVDRRTVMNIVDRVINLANQMSVKDLLKHELKTTIEQMQTAIGPAKITPQMQHNLRNYTEYLKTSLRPSDFLKAWKGEIMVDSLPVTSTESSLAEKGWYFLLGMISLTKFRTQKRLGPGSQNDDLLVGMTFMRLQLQFIGNDWETWFKLAQCFDWELEEEVLWSSDKMNNHRQDLTRLQRSSIHCYLMALSTAHQVANPSFGTAEKLSETYYEFGMRMYASSREPFSMEAFWVDDFEKHMSGAAGMYKKPLHEEMSRYKAWSHAARLFKKSLESRPNTWMAHYMLGKCLWKMFCKPAEELDAATLAKKPTKDTVLRAFIKAIDTCPKPRDSRQEPILEPHYKLVSIVHKLVINGAMPAQDGADLLQKQSFNVNKGESVTITDYNDWEPFVLSLLKVLRNADKQHWQHRMVARVGKIIYDDGDPDYVQATAARNEYRESIFTKTMQVVVWKPEVERAGRHHVYMERYVHLMIKLLWITNDKASMELLAKRIRKKPTEFYRFNQVWTECCNAYLRLIRRSAEIQAGMDDIFRTVPAEEWEVLCDRLTIWIASPDSSSPALDALREAIELKKLNANLMKAMPIDDLINDAYGTLYVQVAKTLPGLEPVPQLDGDSQAKAPKPLTSLLMDMNGTQISVPVTYASTGEATKSRKVGVSRREVLRRAELAISKVEEKPASKKSGPVELPSGLILGSSTGLDVIDHAAATGTASGSGSGATSEAGKATVEAEGGDEEGEESERGSLHDSADDESDLSDVADMEDVDEASIFPDLAANR